MTKQRGEIFIKIKFTVKDVKATEAIKDYVEKKMERIEKYFDDEVDALATMKMERGEQIAEIQVNVKGDMYRAVTASRDLYASIDKDVDILEGQIRKMKTKKDKQNKEASIKQKMMIDTPETVIEDEIVKTIYYDIKPMGPEDAKLKLQEKPANQFFTFINIETGKVNVIYRLKDNKNYGLLEPEA